MFDELRATPEVLYGAIIAFVIVVLLTPAVGGMARMLGAVDRPDARRINRRPIPRLGGLAIFLGILVPSLAFLDLSAESRGVLLGAGPQGTARDAEERERDVIDPHAERAGDRGGDELPEELHRR